MNHLKGIKLPVKTGHDCQPRELKIERLRLRERILQRGGDPMKMKDILDVIIEDVKEELKRKETDYDENSEMDRQGLEESD